jgi:hypothetical protein
MKQTTTIRIVWNVMLSAVCGGVVFAAITFIIIIAIRLAALNTSSWTGEFALYVVLLINSLSVSLQDIVGMDYIQSNPLLNNGKFTLLVNGILGAVLGVVISLIKQISITFTKWPKP